ncbi:MAG: hypothetical protein WBW16_07210 [Bacteroidota bacterium]
MKPSHVKILPRVVIALAFLVSNVGLPIVLVACPAAERPGMDSSCCQAQTEQHAVRLSAFDIRTCCEKTIAVPPLKFESIELNSTTSTVQKLRIELGPPTGNLRFTSIRPFVSLDALAGDVLLLPRDSHLLTLPLRI